MHSFALGKNNFLPRFLPRFFKRCRINAYKHLMETVGVEPTSRDIATQASTRLAGIFVFAYSAAYRQAFQQLA
jgi:hypothetical protein